MVVAAVVVLIAVVYHTSLITQHNNSMSATQLDKSSPSNCVRTHHKYTRAQTYTNKKKKKLFKRNFFSFRLILRKGVRIYEYECVCVVFLK